MLLSHQAPIILMEISLLTSRLAVEMTTSITFILTAALAIIITRRYMGKRTKSLLYWGAGIWIFAAGVLMEIFFAAGAYSTLLIKAYLFLVALLVEFLALGSMQLVKSRKARIAYASFAWMSSALLVCVLAASKMGNIITDHIVYGLLPVYVAISSSIITFPAAIILIAVAVKGYLSRKSNKLLSIISGVVIVSIAGTLYIAQYPAFLYIAEFVGILALWYGFI